jgi:DNA end-binding protein Ku
MAHAVWKGSLSFGLVTIPVGLYAAESPDDLDLDLLDGRDMSPIGYQRINKNTGKKVDADDIVKGYEIRDGEYVVLADEDFAAANVEATQTVEVAEFVSRDEIDPIYYDKPYYLAPLKGGAKAYALLREALRRSDRVGIGRVVIRTRQYTAAVYPRDQVLVVELLRYSHEIRDPGELDLPGESKKQLDLAEKELKMAERLIESMVAPFEPEKYKDEYRDDLLALIKEKAKRGGAEPLREVPRDVEERGAEVVDLMELLKRSMESGGAGAKRKASPARGKRAATATRRSSTTAAKRRPAARAGKSSGRRRKTA